MSHTHLTVMQAARLIGCCRQELLRRINAGKIRPTVRVGRTYGFTQEAIESWIQAHQASKNVVQSEAA
jgi:excisionase family DNA binding protein